MKLSVLLVSIFCWSFLQCTVVIKAESFSCVVDNLSDGPSNSSQCELTGQEGQCTLRNALDFCGSHLENLFPNECTIILPIGDTIMLNSTFGEINIWRAVGTLTLEGNGCHVIAAHPGMRLLAVFDPVSAAATLEFRAFNMHISNFGNSTLEGGGMLIKDTKDSVLRNLTFTKNIAGTGGAIAMERNHNMTLDNIKFYDNYAFQDGGGMYFNRNEFVLLVDCIFIRNIADDRGENENPGRGGGVFFHTQNEDITLRDCLFEYNNALRGASSCLDDQNVGITFERTIFRHNVAIYHSGAVYSIYDNTDLSFLSSIFHNNTSEDGPAIRAWTGNDRMTIISCVFSNNTATSEGGAIFIYSDNRDLSILRSEFIGNSAVQAGGAIFADSANVKIVFNDVSFIENVGARGGAIYWGSRNGEMTFTDVSFVGNIATFSYGGAMSFVSLNTDISFLRCNFFQNKAVSGGGLHFSTDNAYIQIKSSSFSQNSVVLYGGAVYVGQEHRFVLTSNSNCTFNKGHVGAGFFFGPFNTKTSFTNCMFTSNSAVDLGGALVSSSYELWLRDSIIADNTAQSSGGVHVTYTDNHAYLYKDIRIVNCVVKNNRASSVGGVSMVSSANIIVQGTVFDNNTADESESGSLYIFDSYNCTIAKSIFDNNRAMAEGGAIKLRDSHNIQLEENVFSSNSADLGGAMFLLDVSSFLINATALVSNVATLNGGAVWVAGSDGRIAYSMFHNNSAIKSDGSAIWSRDVEFGIEASEFEENRADSGGGAVYWSYHSGMSEPVGLRDDSNTFKRNTALYGANWATEGLFLVPSNNTIHISEFGASSPPFSVHFYDYYNETVRTESTSFGEVSSSLNVICHDSMGYVTGELVQRFQSGIAIFKGVVPYCAPGYSMEISVKANTAASEAKIKFEFRSCVMGEYYGEKICQACPSGSYSFVDPSGMDLDDISSSICEDCPAQADDCFKDSIYLKEGYWRISDTSSSIEECPLESSSCLGGSSFGDDLCSEGYSGALCAVCATGYSMDASSQKCDECSAQTSELDPIFVIVVTFVILAVVASVLLSLNKIIQSKSLDHFIHLQLVNTGFLNSRDAMKEIQLIKNARQSVMTRFAIYGMYFQIISVLPYVLNIKFPEGYHSMLQLLTSFLNLSVSQVTVLSCDLSENYDFVDALLVDTLIPIAVFLLVGVVYLAHVNILRHKRGVLSASEKLGVRNTYIKAYLLYSVVILPYISVLIFKTFSCQDVDPDGHVDGHQIYLRADYSVSCKSSRYAFALAWASCAVVLYIILLPMGYLIMLYRAKEDISMHNMSEDGRSEVVVGESLKHIYMFFRKYQSQFWYWEIVELYFRIAITGFLVLLRPGSFLQVEVGFLLVLLYAKAYQSIWPYKDFKLQVLKLITLWQLFFVFHIVMLVQFEELKWDTPATEGLLFMISFLCLFFDGCVALLVYLSGKWPMIDHIQAILPSFIFHDSVLSSRRNENNEVGVELSNQINPLAVKDGVKSESKELGS